MAAAGAPPSASPSALGRGPGKKSYTRPGVWWWGKAHTEVEVGWGRRGDAPAPSLRMQQQVAATWPVEARRLQARGYGPGRGRSVRNVAVGTWVCVTHSHPRDVLGDTRTRVAEEPPSSGLSHSFLDILLLRCLFVMEAQDVGGSFIVIKPTPVLAPPHPTAPYPTPVSSCSHWGQIL